MRFRLNVFFFQKIISGSDDLHEVTSLEMCVDTRQQTLDNFGQISYNNCLFIILCFDNTNFVESNACH